MTRSPGEEDVPEAATCPGRHQVLGCVPPGMPGTHFAVCFFLFQVSSAECVSLTNTHSSAIVKPRLSMSERQGSRGQPEGLSPRHRKSAEVLTAGVQAEAPQGNSPGACSLLLPNLTVARQLQAGGDQVVGTPALQYPVRVDRGGWNVTHSTDRRWQEGGKRGRQASWSEQTLFGGLFVQNHNTVLLLSAKGTSLRNMHLRPMTRAPLSLAPLDLSRCIKNYWGRQTSAYLQSQTNAKYASSARQSASCLLARVWPVRAAG